MKKENKYIGFISKITIILFLVGLSFWIRIEYIENEKVDQLTTEQEKGLVSLQLDFGEDQKIQEYSAKITSDQSVFDLLKELKLDLEYQDHEEMGIFIKSIEGAGKRDTDKNKWWQYWVNDKYATTSIDSYIIKPGDEIKLKLTEE